MYSIEVHSNQSETDEGAFTISIDVDRAQRDKVRDLVLQELRNLAQEDFTEDLKRVCKQTRVSRLRRRSSAAGISGSNGKTTTKELVSRVLAERFEVYATRGNLNNHIGVPLTLLAMTRDTQFGVVEMGASACGEIALLASIAEPNRKIPTPSAQIHVSGR